MGNCNISGFITNEKFNDIAYLIDGENAYDEISELNIIDSAKIKNGKYQFKIKLTYSKYYSIRLKSHLKGFTFIASPNETFFIQSDTSNFFYPKISGSIQNDYRSKYVSTTDPLIFRMNAYVDSAMLASKDTVLFAKYYNLYKTEEGLIRESNLNFIRKNHKSLTALKLLKTYYGSFNEDSITLFLKDLPLHLFRSPYVEEIRYNKFVFEKDLKKINKFSDLQFVDSLQQNYNPEQLKGKFVLVDFWATWCKPCLENLPKVKHLYNKFPKDKFAILSISLDENFDKWKRELLRLEMKWDNVIDPKNWNGLVVSYLKVTDIPRYILLGKNGELLEKDITPEKLEATISKYF